MTCNVTLSKIVELKQTKKKILQIQTELIFISFQISSLYQNLAEAHYGI